MPERDAFDPANDQGFTEAFMAIGAEEQPPPERQASSVPDADDADHGWGDGPADDDGYDDDDEAEDEETEQPSRRERQEPREPRERQEQWSPPAVTDMLGDMLRGQQQPQQQPQQGFSLQPPPQTQPQQPQQPQQVDYDLLNEATFRSRAETVAQQFLPHFQQAQRDGNAALQQYIGTAYAARVAELEASRRAAAAMSVAQQQYAQSQQVAQVANFGARLAYVFDAAIRARLTIEEAQSALFNPRTRQPVSSREEADARIAEIVASKRRQTKDRGDGMPASSGGSGGGTRRRRDGGFSVVAAMNPFGDDFEQLQQAARSGSPVDLSRWRPTRPAQQRRPAR